LTDTILDNVSIVCTFGKDHATRAFPLTADSLVFREDVEIASGMHVAYFNVDLVGHDVPLRSGPYFILAALHTYVSDVVGLD
jgi:hypothetical protein